MANRNPDTSGLIPFPKGRSGNPGGRPKVAAAREALRRVLTKPRKGGGTILEDWAAEMAKTTGTEARLAILRFLEGSQPPPDAVQVEDDAAERQVNAVRLLIEEIRRPDR